MKGLICKDWTAADPFNPAGSKKLVGAFNWFMMKPDISRARRGRLVEELTTRADFPPTPAEAIETFAELDAVDLGYEEIFDIRDFTNSNANSFSINSTASGLAFKAVPTGAKAEVYKLSGSRSTVYFDRFGGALMWDKSWFEDQDWWAVEDAALEFRNAWYSRRADDFYSLINELPSSINESFATDDATTINNACAKIIEDVNSSGYGATPSSSFIVLAPLALFARIKKAIAAFDAANPSSPGAVKYNVKLIVTASAGLTSNTTYYVVLPKRRAKGGYRQNLTVLTATDILAYAETVAGWGRYAGVIGDANQFRRCAIS